MPSPYASNDLFFARALASLPATLLEAMHAAELTDPGVLRLYAVHLRGAGDRWRGPRGYIKKSEVSPSISPTMSSGMILAVVAKRGTSDLVGSGRRWSRLDWEAAQSEHSCCRHGDVADETTAVDNSVDPSSQSIAHAEACSAIVERVDMELGALPPPLADCESHFEGFCVWQRRHSRPAQTCVSRKRFLQRLVFFFLPVVERIVADSGIFRIFAG